MAVQHVLPGVGEELRKQKFVFSRLKTQAEQLNRLVQTEVKVIQGLVDDAVKRVAASEKCDGSCVHLRQNYSSKCNTEILFEKDKLEVVYSSDMLSVGLEFVVLTLAIVSYSCTFLNPILCIYIALT